VENFGLEFKLAGVFDRINDSFAIEFIETGDLFSNSEFTQKKNSVYSERLKNSNGKKYAVLSKQHFLNQDVSYFKSKIVEKGGPPNTQCHFVSHPFNPRSTAWNIHAVNSEWMVKSLKRMTEARLLLVWENWRSWSNFTHYVNFDRGLKENSDGKVEIGYDRVDFSKLFGILVMVICLKVMAFFVF